MTETEAPLLCAIEAGIAVLTLNRPARLNAFDAALGAAYDRMMVSLDQDPAVRVIVITGSGKGFCAGADVKQLDHLLDSGGKALAALPPGAGHPVFGALQDAPAELRTRFLIPAALSKPVIAAVNGVCAGVGLAIACACDLRFASTGAMFTAAFSRRGLIAEAGLAWILPRLIGYGAASDVLITGRKLLAEEALRIGLVNFITAPEALLDSAVAYARDIVENVSPRSATIIRRQLRQGQEQSLREALAFGHAELKASLASADFREGLAALRERRPPKFTGQ